MTSEREIPTLLATSYQYLGIESQDIDKALKDLTPSDDSARLFIGRGLWNEQEFVYASRTEYFGRNCGTEGCTGGLECIHQGCASRTTMWKIGMGNREITQIGDLPKCDYCGGSSECTLKNVARHIDADDFAKQFMWKCSENKFKHTVAANNFDKFPDIATSKSELVPTSVTYSAEWDRPGSYTRMKITQTAEWADGKWPSTILLKYDVQTDGDTTIATLVATDPSSEFMSNDLSQVRKYYRAAKAEARVKRLVEGFLHSNKTLSTFAAEYEEPEFKWVKIEPIE